MTKAAVFAAALVVLAVLASVGLAHAQPPTTTIYSVTPVSSSVNTVGDSNFCSSAASPDCTTQDSLVAAGTTTTTGNQNLGGGTGFVVTAVTMYFTKESATTNVSSTTVDFRVVASDGITLRADIGQVSFNPTLCNGKTGNSNGAPYCVVTVTNNAGTYSLAPNDMVVAVCVTFCGTVNIDPWGKPAATSRWVWWDVGAQAGTSIYAIMVGFPGCSGGPQATVGGTAGCGLATGAGLIGLVMQTYMAMMLVVLSANSLRQKGGKGAAVAYLRRTFPFLIILAVIFFVAWMQFRSIP